MRIAIAADHRGFALKTELAAWLTKDGHDVVDLGTRDETPVDYPDYAEAVAREVRAGRCERGVLVCGSGVGACVAANKVPESAQACAMTATPRIKVSSTMT